MILRLITASMEEVTPDIYQTVYRTVDFKLPPNLNLSRKRILGCELISDDAPEVAEDVKENEEVKVEE